MLTDLPKNVRRGRELLLSTGSSSQQKWLMMKPKKLHIYPRETAICICPSSGGEMYEYSNWFVQKSWREFGLWGKSSSEIAQVFLIFPQEPLISTRLSLNVSCVVTAVDALIWSSWQLPSWPNGQNPYLLKAQSQAPSFNSDSNI